MVESFGIEELKVGLQGEISRGYRIKHNVTEWIGLFETEQEARNVMFEIYEKLGDSPKLWKQEYKK